LNRAALLLGPVLALALIPSNVVATALPVLREEWNASAAQLGWVYAAYQAGYVASVLLLLPLTDKVRPSLVIVTCSIGVTVVFGLFPLLAVDVWSAAALRMVAGVTLAGVYMPGVRVVAAAASAERRGLMVSVYVGAFYFGAALSLWATGALLPAFGWRGAAYALAGLSALGAPLAIVALRSAPSPPGRSARLDPSVLRHEPVVRNIVGYTAHGWELYISRGWLAAFLASVMVAGGMGTLEASAEGGKLAALMAGLGTLSVPLGGWLSDRWGRANAAMRVSIASGLLSLVFPWLAEAPWLILVMVGCTYGFMVAADSGIYSAAITEYAPPDRIGSAQAFQAFIGFAATAISPVAAGWVLDLGGGWIGAFSLAGVVGLVGAIALAPMARRPRLATTIS
jgi:MFS family permease